MLKKIKWEDGLVLSVKISDGLFTLAQMRFNYLMEFFDVFRSDENWEGVDLNNEDIIFCIFVSIKNIKSIFSGVVTDTSVSANRRPVKTRMLSAIFGSSGNTGANLIELSDKYSNIGGEIVKPSLTVENDLNLIYEYELCGMEGNPDKILERLRIYYETGVSWDKSKEFLFPNIQPPKPSR